MNHDFKDICSQTGSLKESVNPTPNHISAIPATSQGLHWGKHNTSVHCDNRLIDCDISISHAELGITQRYCNNHH